MQRHIIVSQGDTVLTCGEIAEVLSYQNFLDHIVHGDDLKEQVSIAVRDIGSGVFVLELGNGTPAEGLTSLVAWAERNSTAEDAWLIPSSWGATVGLPA